jgi:hypothetical protein
MPTPDFTGREALDNNNLEDIKSILQQILQDNEKNAKSQEQRDNSQEQREIQAASSWAGFTKTVSSQAAKSLPGPFVQTGEVILSELFTLLKGKGNLSNSSGSTPGLSGSIDAAFIKKLQSLVGGGGKGPVGPGGVVAGGMGDAPGGAESAAPGVEVLAAASRLGTVGKVATAAFKIGNAVNILQQKMAESGAITGQGRTAGVGAAFQAFKMGANPFDLLSAQFAQQITDSFRSAGFKDDLAYSLSDSFGSITKTMGESLSKDLLPVATDFASALRASGSTFKEIKDKMDAFDESIISLYKVTKLTSASTHDLNAGFSTLAMNIVKMGGVTDDTGKVVSEFMSRMFMPTPEGGGVSGGQGLVGVGGIGAEQVAQMVTQAAPYLAGRLGIAAPLAFVGDNARKVTNELTNVFKSLYDAAPAMFKTDEGLPQYAAYLLAGFLPGIGMGNFTVDQVVALLRSSGGSAGGAAGRSSHSQFMKNVGIGDIGNNVSDILGRLGKSNVSMKILQDSKKLQNSEAMKQFKAKGGTEQDLVDYAEQKQEDMGRGSLKSYMRSVLLKRNLQNNIDVTDKQKESIGSELDAVKSASSVKDQTGMSDWATDHIKKLMSQLDQTGDVYKQLMNAPSKGLQGLEKAIDITLTLSPTASDQDLISKFFKALQVEAYNRGAPVL